MTAITVYPVFEDSLLLHHSFSGPLLIGGSSWSLDNFTVGLLTAGTITTDPAHAYKAPPSSGGGPAPVTKTNWETIQINKGSVVSGVVTFDVSQSSKQKLTVAGALTIGFSHWPSSGVYAEVEDCSLTAVSADPSGQRAIELRRRLWNVRDSDGDEADDGGFSNKSVS